MENHYDIGMVGLGTMGRNLLLNMAANGYAVVGYDRSAAQVDLLLAGTGGRAVHGTTEIDEFVRSLRSPRAIVMLVPAGTAVDAVIADLLPRIEPGDILIDSGNSHYKDTDRRMANLAGRSITFAGVGISGGEHGARHGASLMFGGTPEAYERVRGLLESVAARVNGEPCVARVGPGSAGHYVKMVHNGIEYGVMQLIAEIYDMMRRGLAMSIPEIRSHFQEWGAAELDAYLIEITAAVLGEIDPETGGPLVEQIRDGAKQKGTGKWTSQEAMDLGIPVPTIDAAVTMRELSALREERLVASVRLHGPEPGNETGEKDVLVARLRGALYTGMIVAYAQGMALLRAASTEHGYELRLEEIARIWRGGCIIRAALLDDIRAAYRRDPSLHNLLLDPDIARLLEERDDALRETVRAAAVNGIPVPALMASLGYIDGYRSARLPANLIQAQRDFFGAHTYERIDREGAFHTEWGAEGVAGESGESAHG